MATLPPGGATHARYMMTRLRRRFPDVRLLLGRWGFEDGEPDTRSEAIKGIDGVDRTLADSRKRLAELHATLATDGGNFEDRAERPASIGTAGA